MELPPRPDSLEQVGPPVTVVTDDMPRASELDADAYRSLLRFAAWSGFAVAAFSMLGFLWNDIGGTASGDSVGFEGYSMTIFVGLAIGAFGLVVANSARSASVRLATALLIFIVSLPAGLWTLFVIGFDHSYNW
jgi:hypothetical protein